MSTIGHRLDARIGRVMRGNPNRFTVWMYWHLASVLCDDYLFRDLEPDLARHASNRLTNRLAKNNLTHNGYTPDPVGWEPRQCRLAAAILTNPHIHPDLRRTIWEHAYTHVTSNVPGSDLLTPGTPRAVRRAVGRFRSTYGRTIPDTTAWTALATTLHTTTVNYPDVFTTEQAHEIRSFLFLNALAT